MLLLAVFAAVAVVLAAVGIYSVLAYLVRRRGREIGIRIALGARGRQIFGLVTGGGVKLVLLGLGIGTAAALAATRLLESLLFEVRPTDPATYAGIAAIMLAAGALAGAIPARKASKIDPIEALRTD